MSIKPVLPSGFKDYSPKQVMARDRILKTIAEVYRRFGFVPLQTSIAQRRLVLTGGKAVENRLFDLRVKGDRLVYEEDAVVTARFDLTVPLARYVAENIADITFPFRRYEVGDVFRGETPQAGRYCEFAQFDADIVGAETGPADAEIIVCMHTVMKALGVDRFVIRVNNRKILNGFTELMGLTTGSKQAAALLRVMDKVDKIGLDGVIAEIERVPETKKPEESDILTSVAASSDNEEQIAFHFSPKQIEQIRTFMTLTSEFVDNESRLVVLAGYFHDGGIGSEGVRELDEITNLIRASGVPDSDWMIDVSIARGLGYYTGPVFETTLLDKPDFGSVYSGGRFDDLVARFTGESLPSVGASVGVDRLFAALETLGMISSEDPDVDVYIMMMSPDLMADYFAMAAKLRAAGIRTEINMNHQDTSLKAQITFGFSRNAPIFLFYGPDDARDNAVGVKDTVRRTQKRVKRETLISEVLTVLGRST